MNKEDILHLLRTDKRAVARALVVLHARQTRDEQMSEGTHYDNGRGFRPCHAKMGTSMAKQFLRYGSLSDKQIGYWRVKDASGQMRIGIYTRQLLEEVAEKQRKPKMRSKMDVDITQRRATLELELGMCMDSEDSSIIDPIRAEIDELDAFMIKMRTQG